MNLNKVKNIVWLQTAFPGDLVLTSSALALANKELPEINQYLITNKHGELILSDVVSLQNIIVIDKKNDSFLKQFKIIKNFLSKNQLRKKDTVVIQVHKSPRSSLLTLLLNYPLISYKEAFIKIHADITVARVALFHESIRIGLLLEPFGIQRELILKITPYLKKLPQHSELSNFSNMANKNEKVVLLATGSVWETKKWSIQKFSKLVNLLLALDNIKIVLTGSAKELIDNEYICNENREHKSRILNLTNKTTLKELRGVFPYVDLVICNDSAPIHFASAFDINTVAIFGSTTTQMGFAPLAKRFKIAENNEIICRPCGAHGHKKCPIKSFVCMDSLGSEYVYALATKLLD